LVGDGRVVGLQHDRVAEVGGGGAGLGGGGGPGGAGGRGAVVAQQVQMGGAVQRAGGQRAEPAVPAAGVGDGGDVGAGVTADSCPGTVGADGVIEVFEVGEPVAEGEQTGAGAFQDRDAGRPE